MMTNSCPLRYAALLLLLTLPACSDPDAGTDLDPSEGNAGDASDQQTNGIDVEPETTGDTSGDTTFDTGTDIADATQTSGATGGTETGCELEPGLFIADEAAPFGPAIDERALWWTALGAGGERALRRYDLATAAAETVHSRPAGMASVVVDGGVAYFTDREAGSLHAWRMDGGERTLSMALAGVDSTALAVVEGFVVVLVHGEDARGFAHRLLRVPVTGGAAEQLATVTVGVADGDLNAPIRVGDDGLYWTSVTGALFRYDPALRQIDTVLDIAEGIRAFDIERTAAGDAIWFVRWTDETEIEVLRPGVQIPERIVAAARAGMAVHASSGLVYWPRDDGVYRYDTMPGSATPERIAAVTSNSVTGFVQHGADLYWANTAMGPFGGGLGRACLVGAPPASTWRATLESPALPLKTGTQTVVVALADDTGAFDPPTVRIGTWMPEHGHAGGPDATATSLGSGRYQAEVGFSMAGAWELRVTAIGSAVVIPVTVVDAR